MGNSNSDSDILLLLATTLLAIISFSYLFEDEKKKKKTSLLDEDGFSIDNRNFQKDFRHISNDIRTAEKKFVNVR